MKNFILVGILLLVFFPVIGCDSKQSLIVKHKITYSQKGSRSEAQHGHLKINGKRVAAHFSYIIVNKKHFSFFTRQHLWGFDGYHPVTKKEMKTTIQNSDKAITKTHKTRGWYIGSKKLIGTPDNWLYLKWGAGEGFSLFEKIPDLIKINKIPFLKRRGLPPGFMIKSKGIK